MTGPATRAPRRTAETLTPAVLLVLGVGYGVQSLREGIGTASATGAGFFPLLVAVLLVGSSALVLLQQRRAAPAGDPGSAGLPTDDEGAPVGSDDGGTDWRRIAGVVLATLAVPLLAETVGFVVVLSAAVAVIAKLMGLPGILRPLVLGVVFGAVAWLVFVHWLFVPLPAGVLGLG